MAEDETNWVSDPVTPEGIRVERVTDAEGEWVLLELDGDDEGDGVMFKVGEVHDLCRAMMAAAHGYPRPVPEGQEPMEVVIAPKGEIGTVGIRAPHLVVGIQMGWYDARNLALKILDAAALSGSTQFLIDNGWTRPLEEGETITRFSLGDQGDRVDEFAEAAPPDPDTFTITLRGDSEERDGDEWNDPGSPFGEEPPGTVIHEASHTIADID